MGWVDKDFEGMIDQGTMTASETPSWDVRYCVEKRWLTADADHKAGDYEFIGGRGNTLMNGGASVLWERLITKNPTTSSTGTTLQAFSTDNAVIGVSTSSTAVTATLLDINGANRAYGGMESGYPAHTDGTASTTARQVSFRHIFLATQANIDWNKWAVLSSTAPGGASTGGRMLNSKVQSLGTKTSSAQWTFTVTLSLS